MPIPCRTCQKPLEEPLGPRGPFCSERCRLLDLGKWADGSYHVPGEAITSGEEPPDEGLPERGGPQKPKTVH